MYLLQNIQHDTTWTSREVKSRRIVVKCKGTAQCARHSPVRGLIWYVVVVGVIAGQLFWGWRGDIHYSVILIEGGLGTEILLFIAHIDWLLIFINEFWNVACSQVFSGTIRPCRLDRPDRGTIGKAYVRTLLILIENFLMEFYNSILLQAKSI
jgi:hypothetical protein